jgi:hypothetical protein
MILNEQVCELFHRFLTDPTYKPVRDQIRENPDDMESVLEQIKTLSPEMHELFEQNSENLEHLVNQVIEGSQIFEDEDDEEVELTEEQLNSLPAESICL